VEKDGVWVKVFVDGYLLGIQCSFFKMTMLQIMNIKRWGMIDSFVIFKQKPLAFIKLVEIACVQVLGFVEDEC
jgi:hypothetical protein